MIHLTSMKETAALKKQLAQKNAENQKLKAHFAKTQSAKAQLAQSLAEQERVKAQLAKSLGVQEKDKEQPKNVPSIKLSINGNNQNQHSSNPSNRIGFTINGK